MTGEHLGLACPYHFPPGMERSHLFRTKRQCNIRPSELNHCPCGYERRNHWAKKARCGSAGGRCENPGGTRRSRCQICHDRSGDAQHSHSRPSCPSSYRHNGHSQHERNERSTMTENNTDPLTMREILAERHRQCGPSWSTVHYIGSQETPCAPMQTDGRSTRFAQFALFVGCATAVLTSLIGLTVEIFAHAWLVALLLFLIAGVAYLYVTGYLIFKEP